MKVVTIKEVKSIKLYNTKHPDCSIAINNLLNCDIDLSNVNISIKNNNGATVGTKYIDWETLFPKECSLEITAIVEWEGKAADFVYTINFENNERTVSSSDKEFLDYYNGMETTSVFWTMVDEP